MNLVVGATGMLGGEICRQLVAAGKPVRALVRSTSDPAKVQALRDLGAEIVEGDVRDRASLVAACAGATAVIWTASSMPFSYIPGENDVEAVDLEGAKAVIDAAVAAGAERIVYTSFTPDVEHPLRNAKRAVETHIKDSGLTYTVLRPSYFMEVWLSPAVGFDAANAKATIYGTGEQPVSWISFPDVAKFAVASLDNLAARNAVLPLGGPEALTPNQVVAIFERSCHKSFELQYVPVDALAAQQAAATDPMQQSFAGLMRGIAQGDAVDMTAMLKVFPFELTSVEQYAADVYA
ncbi:MAG: SDR family oxidoreductase [Anaerolineae bacterium]